MIKKILGFDISSTTIGWCLLELNDQTNDIKFISCNYLKPPKKGDIFQRLVETRKKITEIINKFKPDYIGVEDIIQFMKGASGAKTIIMLALFNRTIGLAAYDYLGKSPQLFNVMQIRHGLKTDKELPKKEEMPELVAKHLGITFPYVYKKNGNIADESCDMADGVAVALYYSFVLSGKVILKDKKPKKKKKGTK